MKKCTQCNELKPETEFPFAIKKIGRLDTRCKLCHRANSKRHYQSNPKNYKKRSKERQEQSYAWLAELKSALKCEKCGENHIACLDFHHSDPKQKDFAVSRMVHLKSKEVVLAEIAKCEVLCSNCHRKLHWAMKN